MNREHLNFGDLVRIFDGPNTFVGFVVRDYTTVDHYRFVVAVLDDPNYFNFVKGKSWNRYGLKDNMYLYEDGGRASFSIVSFDFERTVESYYIDTSKSIEKISGFDITRYTKNNSQTIKIYNIKYYDRTYTCCYSVNYDMAEWSTSSADEAYYKLMIKILKNKIFSLEKSTGKKRDPGDPDLYSPYGPYGPYGLNYDELMDQD